MDKILTSGGGNPSPTHLLADTITKWWMPADFTRREERFNNYLQWQAFTAQQAPTEQPATQQNEQERTIRSFGDGMALSGKRFLNDMKYVKGYIGDLFSPDRSEQSKEALRHLPEYESSNDAELEAKRDSLERQIEREPLINTRNELKGLKDYQRMRKKGMSQQQIKEELSDMIQWGTPGRREMEEALETNNAFPEAEGAAIVGNIAADMGRVAIPTLIGIASLPVGIVAGGGAVMTSLAESHAQAQMEMENYERATGKKLSKAERVGFSAINVGIDFIISGILQSRFLKNLKPAIKKRASAYFKKHVLTDRVAQHEVKSLMNRLEQNEKWAMLNTVKQDISASAIGEGINSLAHDAASTIYRNPEDYPSLNELLRNIGFGMVYGGISGGLTSGVGVTARQYKRNANRERDEATAVISTPQNVVEVIDLDPESRIAEVISPDGQSTQSRIPVHRNDLKVFSWKDEKDYRRAMKEIDEPDPLLKIDNDPNKEAAWASMSILGKRNMVLDLAHRMGLNNIDVYQHTADLSRSAFMVDSPYDSPPGCYYLHNGHTAIVLDKVSSYNQVQHLLLYEAVARQGLNSIFGGNRKLYNMFLLNVYESMPELSKVNGDTYHAKLLDAKTYITDLAAAGVKSTPLKRIIGKLKDPLMLLFPGIEISDDDIKDLILRAQEDLRDDDSWVGNWRRGIKIAKRPLGNHDYPITGISESTLRYFQENDPLWRKYKRFYDEVYGDDTPEHTEE